VVVDKNVSQNNDASKVILTMRRNITEITAIRSPEITAADKIFLFFITNYIYKFFNVFYSLKNLNLNKYFYGYM
jgi:hypothetical protein